MRVKGAGVFLAARWVLLSSRCFRRKLLPPTSVTPSPYLLVGPNSKVSLGPQATPPPSGRSLALAWLYLVLTPLSTRTYFQRPRGQISGECFLTRPVLFHPRAVLVALVMLWPLPHTTGGH